MVEAQIAPKATAATVPEIYRNRHFHAVNYQVSRWRQIGATVPLGDSRDGGANVAAPFEQRKHPNGAAKFAAPWG